MPTSVLQRKAIFFVVFAAIVTLILVFLPFVETWIQSYILSRFNLAIAPDGSVVSTDGGTLGMMSVTSIDLILNLFHIVKIFLWMALIISVVRFMG